MKIDEKGRYDLDSLEPGQGVARFWDGHEEPLEYWKHVYFVGTYNDKYEERAISINNEIISILYKEKEND